MSTTNKEVEREKSRANARTFGGIVYVGGVSAATVMFISFVLTAFPENAYVTRVIMTVASVAVGLSMLAFPVAMHSWVVTERHRAWGTALYYGELLIVAINTIVAFVTLLSANGGTAAPEWAVLYEPFSVGAIVYSIAAWGTLMLLDPEHKEYADDQENDAALRKQTAALKKNFLETERGQQLAAQMAEAEIVADWTVERHLKRKGLVRPATNLPMPVAGTPFEQKQAVTPPLPELDDKPK